MPPLHPHCVCNVVSRHREPCSIFLWYAFPTRAATAPTLICAVVTHQRTKSIISNFLQQATHLCRHCTHFVCALLSVSSGRRYSPIRSILDQIVPLGCFAGRICGEANCFQQVTHLCRHCTHIVCALSSVAIVSRVPPVRSMPFQLVPPLHPHCVCAVVSHQRTKAIISNFSSTGEPCGPPLHPRCVCAVVSKQWETLSTKSEVYLTKSCR